MSLILDKIIEFAMTILLFCRREGQRPEAIYGLGRRSFLRLEESEKPLLRSLPLSSKHPCIGCEEKGRLLRPVMTTKTRGYSQPTQLRQKLPQRRLHQKSKINFPRRHPCGLLQKKLPLGVIPKYYKSSGNVLILNSKKIIPLTDCVFPRRLF